MCHRRRLVALALALSTAFAASAAAPASAQERLHLEIFGDEGLHRLTLPVDGDPILWALQGAAGFEADLARGAAPTPAWPFAFTGDLGFGLRHGVTDVLQIRSQAVVPLPV